ncbi:MAG: hypothetical protein AAF191_01535 [Verrucomicrobiota bacterium]
MQDPQSIGPCPLCGRDLLPGDSVNEHHLIPKSLKGREKFPIHVICHSKIHSVFTERELRETYHTWERLRAHGEIQKFLSWVQKQPPTLISRNRRHGERGRRRREHSS